MADEKLSNKTETIESTSGFLHIIRDIGSGLQSFKISTVNLFKTTSSVLFGGQVTGGTHVKSFSATASFNLNNGNSQEMVLSGNVTSLALTNKVNGGSYLIWLIQDATGSRTIPTPGSSFGVATDNSAPFVEDADAVNIINVNVRPNGTTYWTNETYTP